LFHRAFLAAWAEFTVTALSSDFADPRAPGYAPIANGLTSPSVLLYHKLNFNDRLTENDLVEVKVHRKGIIVIPAEVRRRLNIKEGSVMELEVEGDKIVLKRKMTLLDMYGADKEMGDSALKELERLRKEGVERENSV
jgi:AbrB family looped-hinge helix DNA binding protein